MILKRSIRSIGFMALLKNCIAVLRGNIKCIINKLFHISSFCYNPYLRIYGGVSVTLRNRGKIALGKNVKIDSQALLSANGGKIILGDGVGIGRDNIIVSQEQISIGSGTILGPNVLIYDHDHKFDSAKGVIVNEYNRASVSIGDNCWIAAGVIILKGVTIGTGSVVAAGTVVKQDVPPNTIVYNKRETVMRSRC